MWSSREAGLSAVSTVALLLLPGIGLADESDARLERLEKRIEELETAGDARSTLADWAQHISLGGSARTGWYGGQQDSSFHDDNFQVWDARFFIDAELGDDARIGDQTLVRNVGFSFE